MVRFYMAPDSFGMVVEKINDDECEVLWSNSSNPWDKVVRHRRIELFPNRPTNISGSTNASRCSSFLPGYGGKKNER